MRVKSSYLFAGGFFLAVVVLFLIIGLLNGGKKEQAQASTKADETPIVQTVIAQPVVRPTLVVLRGRTEAARTVSVRSETAGVVSSTPAREGAFVGRGAVLCRLDVDARKATLDQARAALKQRELQMQASTRLAAQGYRSQTQVLSDQANLDAASAGVRQAEIALEQINIRAPFAGVFDHRDAEVGTYLSPGQPCGTMIELSPLLVVGDVPETEASQLHLGAAATATLVSGQVLNGRIRYVARDADPQTRTYRVEVAAPNPGGAARSGLSAEVRIFGAPAAAHLVPTAALVLDAAGRQGVRWVGSDGLVGFTPVKVIEETDEGTWVGGLAGPVQVITVGQSYVDAGQKVRVAAR